MSALVIDSALFRGVGASAKPNACFVPCSRSGTARIEITRRVRAEEIFISYGRDYWKKSHSSTHSTVNVPDWEWDLSNPFASVPRLLAMPGRPATGPWSVRSPDQAVLRFRSVLLLNQIHDFLINPLSVPSSSPLP